MLTSTTGSSYYFNNTKETNLRKKHCALRSCLAFLCFPLLRSLEPTSSCESGRSTVVTLRCNAERSTKGELTVPRYFISVTVSLIPFPISPVTRIYAVTSKWPLVFGRCSQCPAGTCDGCTFHFLWESSGACPTCTERDYHQIEGACKGGHQVCVFVDIFIAHVLWHLCWFLSKTKGFKMKKICTDSFNLRVFTPISHWLCDI